MVSYLLDMYIFIPSIYTYNIPRVCHLNPSEPFWAHFPSFRISMILSDGTLHLGNLLREPKTCVTSSGLSGLRRITNWIIPRMFPSMDIDRLSVSIASWLDFPKRDSPLTAISWSFIRRRPS